MGIAVGGEGQAVVELNLEVIREVLKQLLLEKEHHWRALGTDVHVIQTDLLFEILFYHELAQ